MHTESKDTYFGNPTKIVFGEVSKKLIGIVKDVPTEITEQQSKNDLRRIAVKRCQTNRQPFPVIKRTFESESEYLLAVFHGICISNMHFKVEPKITKMKLLQCYNCQKWGNHVPKMCKYQPICVICGYDHPSRSNNDYVCRNSTKYN